MTGLFRLAGPSLPAGRVASLACVRRIMPALLVALLPCALVVLTVRTKASRGPYWLGTNFDPEYIYLVDALALCRGEELPTMLVHPGTPAMLLGAGVLRTAHLFRGERALEEDVLLDPEWYLNAIHHVFLTLNAAALFLVGLVSLRITGSLFLAGLSQAAPFLSANGVLLDSMPRVAAEPVLFALVLVFAASVCVFVGRGTTRGATGSALWWGVLLGCASATKITAAPLFVFPMVLLPRWHKLTAILCGVVIAVALTFPIWSRLGELLAFYELQFSHMGTYGTGEAGVIDPDQYWGGIRTLWTLESGFFGIAIANLLCLAWWAINGRGIRVLRTPDRPSHSREDLLIPQGASEPERPAPGQPDCAGRLIKALVACTIVEVVTIVCTAKQPVPRYLAPAVALLGLNAALLFRMVRHLAPGRCGWLIVGVGLVLAGQILKINLQDYRSSRRAFRRWQEAQLGLCQHVERHYRAAVIVHHYGASSIPYDLWMASRENEAVRVRNGLRLQKLYGPCLFYDSQYPGGKCWDWSEPVAIEEIKAGPAGIIFRGMAFCQWNYRPDHLQLRQFYPEWPETPVDGADFPVPEVLYRLAK